MVFNKIVAYLIAGYASFEEPTGGGMFRHDVGEMSVRAEMEESYQNTDKTSDFMLLNIHLSKSHTVP